MITQSIKRPGFVTGFLRSSLDMVRGRVQQHQAPSYVYKHKSDWGKLVYTNWIEEVKKEFAVGDLVCYHGTAPKADTLPYYQTIVYIEEMHSDVTWDNYHQQPCAVTARDPALILMKRCPKGIRKLTQEEVSLVRLQNSKVEGTA
jgi:hypothetical protein